MTYDEKTCYLGDAEICHYAADGIARIYGEGGTVVRMGAKLVLFVHDHERNRRFGYVTDCLPATIGRNPNFVQCALEGDPNVSRIHASVDLREGHLLVCDEMSASGTIVDSYSLPPGQWVRVGSPDEIHEIAIRDWKVFAQAATDEVLRGLERDGYELRTWVSNRESALPRKDEDGTHEQMSKVWKGRSPLDDPRRTRHPRHRRRAGDFPN